MTDPGVKRLQPAHDIDRGFRFTRRECLKMAAGAVAGALPACSPPREEIVPYVEVPEHVVPGTAVFYTSVLTVSGYALGVLVETHTGRPIKIEGNPKHPASLGATDVFSQAALPSLYDPDRARTITVDAQTASWSEFANGFLAGLRRFEQNGGRGFHVLTTSVSSPVVADRIARLREKLPRMQWHEYEPVNRDRSREGARLAYGETLDTTYDFTRAELVLSLDSHFLEATPATVRYAHDFIENRRPEDLSMNRLYCIESRATPTGVLADHRLPVKASEVENLARMLAHMLEPELPAPQVRPDHRVWLKSAADDLREHAGRGIVIAGEWQPPVVHALVHAINEKLGNTGNTVIHREPVTARAVNQMQSLKALAGAMRDGEVESLVIIDGNPAYDTPADIEFSELLEQVPDTLHWSLYRNETSERCRRHVPATHELESWGDARAFDGTASIRQPAIVPLFGGHPLLQLLALLEGDVDFDAYAAVRNYWKRRSGLNGAAFERGWRHWLQQGFIDGTQSPVRTPALQWASLREQLEKSPAPPEGLEITFDADPTVRDGGFAHNRWLQELPKPITRLTWDNALLVNPKTAEKLHVGDEDVVELALNGRRIEAPVLLVKEQPDDTVALSFGYGRDVFERNGANAFALQPSGSPGFAAPLLVERTGRRYPLAVTQHHHRMDAKQPVKNIELESLRVQQPAGIAKPLEIKTLQRRKEEKPSLYPEPLPAPEPGGESAYDWGMSINLNSCIGCNACTVACQAENNIPSVGKQEVLRGHEMHWIRVDYYSADEESGAPAGYFQPVPCMHCENAPCEYVCPVAATLHDSEGLNAQIYNRCIGTRDCSQNCPYKVRRFNWFDYNYGREGRALAPLRNPSVTVRSRGVMEKCTYCVQRISRVRREAKKEDRPIRDGELKTACQQACPTNAIVFGNINDENSGVSREKAGPLDYDLLADLNTRPRTSYKAHVTNARPPLKDEVGPDE